MEGQNRLQQNTVIIVVPIYKTHLSVVEEISLRQVFRILGSHHKICFIAPDSLQISLSFSGTDILRFPDRFFRNTTSYSKLLLSEEFYRRFVNYEFLLIYQLDAFVFSDRLQEFCSLGYDYIGAPVPRPYWGFLKKKVGNGGFSLRRVSAFLRVLAQKNKVLKQAKQVLGIGNFRGIVADEDQFWAYCSTMTELNFKTPSIAVAKQFSIEYDVGHVYRNLEHHLPFGCHRWYMDNFDVWWPVIVRYGYVLSDEDKAVYTCNGKYTKARIAYIYDYLFRRIIKYGRPDRLQAGWKAYFCAGEDYSIWGYGKIGKLCLQFFYKVGLRVSRIYTEVAKRDQYEKNIPVLYPDEDLLLQRSSKILIATTKYQDEIKKKLDDMGLKSGKDYYLLAEFECMVCRGYYLSKNKD